MKTEYPPRATILTARKIAKYPSWQKYHESRKGGKYRDFIGRIQTISDADHHRRASRYVYEAAKKILSELRRNPMAPIHIPIKVLSWREKLRKGSIMKPSTFKSIKRKGAARYKKKGVGKKVAGKAYQVTLLRRYLDIHPGDKYVEGILRKLVGRKYRGKVKKNPSTKWYIGLYGTGRTRRFSGSVIFSSSVRPTRGRFPKYKKVIGPFSHFNEAEKYREENR